MSKRHRFEYEKRKLTEWGKSRDQVAWEQVFDALTHSMGFVMSIIGLNLMLFKAIKTGGAARIVSAAVFGTGLIVLYGASTLYHSFYHTRHYQWLKTLDHSSIYILITATYAPFMLVTLGGTWGITIFTINASLTVFGIVFKIFMVHRFEVVSTIVYLIMGWLIVIAIYPMSNAMEPMGLFFIALGGAFYTLGIIFFAWEKLPFNHSIWHIFVMGGSFSHFMAAYYYVL